MIIILCVFAFTLLHSFGLSAVISVYIWIFKYSFFVSEVTKNSKYFLYFQECVAFVFHAISSFIYQLLLCLPFVIFFILLNFACVTVFTYLIIFRLEEIGIQNMTHFAMAADQQKIHQVVQ